MAATRILIASWKRRPEPAAEAGGQRPGSGRCGLPRALASEIRLPELLERVIFAHLRPEQVHDHVAGVDQAPVARIAALGMRAPDAGRLELFEAMPGHRVDTAGRSSAFDPHVIVTVCFSPQRDGLYMVYLFTPTI